MFGHSSNREVFTLPYLCRWAKNSNFLQSCSNLINKIRHCIFSFPYIFLSSCQPVASFQCFSFPYYTRALAAGVQRPRAAAPAQPVAGWHQDAPESSPRGLCSGPRPGREGPARGHLHRPWRSAAHRPRCAFWWWRVSEGRAFSEARLLDRSQAVPPPESRIPRPLWTLARGRCYVTICNLHCLYPILRDPRGARLEHTSRNPSGSTFPLFRSLL